jgi:divalent metal cation (Fe/Co/Zn/Cd) transporter
MPAMHSLTTLTPLSDPLARAADIRRALWLTYITLAWMTVEGAVTLILGYMSSSLLLEAFGMDSMVELFSGGVLLWRLRAEAGGPASDAKIEAVERKASRLAGGALLVLALYVVVNSTHGLLAGRQPGDTSESIWGVVVGLIATFGMPVLAGYKINVAARLNSRALRADAMEAVTCGYLSLVLIAGLAATWLFGWWWLDCAAALALVPFLLKEGNAAIRGNGCCGGCCENDSPH